MAVKLILSASGLRIQRRLSQAIWTDYGTATIGIAIALTLGGCKSKEEAWWIAWIAAPNATIATPLSDRGKDGCARRFTISCIMTRIQVIAATTLNLSPCMKRAAEKNTKWSEKSSGPTPTLLKVRSRQQVPWRRSERLLSCATWRSGPTMPMLMPSRCSVSLFTPIRQWLRCSRWRHQTVCISNWG